MYLLFLCWMPLVIDAFAIVRIHSNSFYRPIIPHTSIRNTTWLNGGSLQACIWECVHEPHCQTAVYLKDDQICSIFRELCRTDCILSSPTVSASVICYQQSHGPIITSSPIATTVDQNDRKTTEVSGTTTRTETTFVASTIPLIQSCDILRCRDVIADYISKTWAYHTTSFTQCMSCPYAQYPNFPVSWLSRWYTENVFIANSGGGGNCPGNPKIGDLASCQKYCLEDITCVGFGRKKSVSDTDANGACWLKTNMQLNPILNDSVWHTLVFNTTS